LPRTTGLLFCLRSLAARVPDLVLVDATVAYPNIPDRGFVYFYIFAIYIPRLRRRADRYGQDHYTLQSVFGAGQPPRKVHVHLRFFRLSDIPLGDVSTSAPASDVGAQTSEAERVAFDTWLRERWVEKDERLKRFYANGAMDDTAKVVEVPITLKGLGDLGTLFASAAAPLWVARTAWKGLRALLRWTG
jgi:lysocardiolipin and lysophospholipid acyltransferase